MKTETTEYDSDLIECSECGNVFAALRCPALDCQSEQKGLRIIGPAEAAVLDRAAAIPYEVLHAPIVHAEQLYPLCDEIQRWRRQQSPEKERE